VTAQAFLLFGWTGASAGGVRAAATMIGGDIP
jgi:hypothetical protein